MIKDEGHIKAMQEGRAQGVVVRKYLSVLSGDAIERPKRDNSKQLAKIKEDLAIVTNPLQRLKLLQRQYDLVNGKDETEQIIDLAAIEREFVEVAKPYSERSGIVREVWLDMGVEDRVLDEAGL